MDKVQRAIIGVEENSAKIAALRAMVNAQSEMLKSLETKSAEIKNELEKTKVELTAYMSSVPVRTDANNQTTK